MYMAQASGSLRRRKSRPALVPGRGEARPAARRPGGAPDKRCNAGSPLPGPTLRAGGDLRGHPSLSARCWCPSNASPASDWPCNSPRRGTGFPPRRLLGAYAARRRSACQCRASGPHPAGSWSWPGSRLPTMALLRREAGHAELVFMPMPAAQAQWPPQRSAPAHRGSRCRPTDRVRTRVIVKYVVVRAAGRAPPSRRPGLLKPDARRWKRRCRRAAWASCGCSHSDTSASSSVSIRAVSAARAPAAPRPAAPRRQGLDAPWAGHRLQHRRETSAAPPARPAQSPAQLAGFPASQHS